MEYTTKHCIFCGEAEKLKELYPQNFKSDDLTPEIFSARRVTEHFHYEIVRCRKCGLIFSRKILPDEALAMLYSKSNVTFNEYVDIIGKDYLRHLKPFIGEVKKGSALEIGCSSGFFLEKLIGEGFMNVYGCEPSIEAKEKSAPKIKKNIHSGFFKSGIYKNDSFDLVCSFQTLDHLSDPAGAVRICRDILKPGGTAYFVTHDVDSLQARILRERSPIIDVEHIYLFNKNTLRRLFEDAGFKVIKAADLKNSYPLNYWFKMLFGRGVGLLGSVSFPIAAGNIFVIAKKNGGAQ